MTFEVFHIKFKGSKTIPTRTLVIYKDNTLSLDHPKALPKYLRDHYGPKLATDIAPNTMRVLPQVLIRIITFIHCYLSSIGTSKPYIQT